MSRLFTEKRKLFWMARRHRAKHCNLTWWPPPGVAASPYACGASRAGDNLQEKSLETFCVLNYG